LIFFFLWLTALVVASLLRRSSQKHLGREAPFKTMYIMAAVDCDIEKIKKGSLEKDESEIFGGAASVGGPRFYEKVR
jgi:hypothetical protein